ncbi:TIGR03790 family protein [Haloferula sargassicola]|uniref:TIGR03790 family protein n=1 Tax=Haloferula sargassicola TaxID=490096 RepID=A0ABP9UW49_9BACT
MFRLLALLAFLATLVSADEIDVNRVVVLFNSRLPESRELAKYYAAQRDIPAEQLLGLELPDKEQISRDEFNSLLRDPLIKEFDRHAWWTRRRLPSGEKQFVATRVRIIACMRGVPSRIFQPEPKEPERKAGEKPDPQANQRRMMMTSSAAVDSELTLLGIPEARLEGPLDNPYFKSMSPIGVAQVPILLVGRIDGPSFDLCRRMIDDAVAVEKTGLWGFGVVDIANKSDPRDPSGDPWFRTAAEDLESKGIPVLVDRFNQTLPDRFPLPPTAIYYGWYAWNVDGPFASKDFRFKRGAVAVHLHSFSAAQLRKGNANWCAPLLARGAAATLGNVFEPFLHLTHHLDIFNDRLLAGNTLIESAYMAMPALSWQGVVLGDPLYRPFAHLDGSGEKQDADRVFRALRIAKMRWKDDAERRLELKKAAVRMKSGEMTEALALECAESSSENLAATLFRDAGNLYKDRSDQLRMELMVVKLDRERKLDDAAKQGLRIAIERYPDLPGRAAAQAWLNVLDPPPKPAGKK